MLKKFLFTFVIVVCGCDSGGSRSDSKETLNHGDAKKKMEKEDKGPEIKVQNPSSADITIVTSTSLTLVWRMAENAQVDGYRITYANSGTAGSCLESTPKISESEIGTAKEFTIGNLSPDTEYSIRICTIKSEREASGKKLDYFSEGLVIAGRTYALDPGEVGMVGLLQKDLSLAEVDVTWEPVVGAKSYKVAYSQNTSLPAEHCIGGENVTAPGHTIKLLKILQQVNVRVCAYNENSVSGTTVGTLGSLFVQGPPVPEVIELSVTPEYSFLGGSTAKVTWRPPSTSPGSGVMGYMLAFNDDGSDPQEGCVSGQFTERYSQPSASFRHTFHPTRNMIRVCVIGNYGGVLRTSVGSLIQYKPKVFVSDVNLDSVCAESNSGIRMRASSQVYHTLPVEYDTLNAERLVQIYSEPRRTNDAAQPPYYIAASWSVCMGDKYDRFKCASEGVPSTPVGFYITIESGDASISTTLKSRFHFSANWIVGGTVMLGECRLIRHYY